jgi:sortase A
VLEHVVVGDLIALDSLTGTRRYRVTELSVVEPEDLRPLHELGVPAITLVTCYPFYFVGNAPQRFIVRAVATN